MQRNKISSNRQKVFIGIDVHLNSWVITILKGKYFQPVNFTQPPSAKALIKYLKKNFPNCEYHAVYESGFTGFSTYYALEDEGIHAYIVNAADVPTTQKETIMKNDKRDSIKLAEALRDGKVVPLYIHSRENLDDRSLVRLRKTFVREESASKARVKHLLYTNGVEIPSEFKYYWSQAFIKWLREEVKLLGETKQTLIVLLNHVEVLHKECLAVNKLVRKLLLSEKYRENVRRLMTIPGVGQIMAITLLVEIEDFNRFPNTQTYASFLGIVPTSHDSGEKVSRGEKTFRGNKYIGSLIIECCWKLIRKDLGMNMYFEECSKHMVKNKAIIKVARRLSNIMLLMMKTGTDYDPSKIQK